MINNGVCDGGRVGEEPCLYANDERADEVLAQHFVDTDAAVIQNWISRGQSSA